MHVRVGRFASCLALLLIAGCDPAATDIDAGGDDAGLFDAGPPPVEPPFNTMASGTSFQTTAGDFTVQTLDGPWTLSEEWNGEDSYVFIAHNTSPYGEALWGTLPDELATLGPRNVHYFFATHDTDAAVARGRVEAMQALMEEGFELAAMPEEDRVYWRTHLHYVVEGLSSAEGSVRTLVRSMPGITAFAVTRQQLWDQVGSLQEFTPTGIFPRMRMARFAAPYYDYLYELEERLRSETDATLVPILTNETLTARRVERTLTLPDASAMAAFDTLEVDVELTCHLGPAGCSEWDRIAYVQHCDDTSCTTTQEIVRWITPYSRPGARRWVMDATPFLGMVRSGGEQTFRVIFGPEFEEATERVVSVVLRFSTRGETDSASATELAFRGGAFNADYNLGRAPYRFTPPAGTTRVELAVIVSGHGMATDNCAEWCDHVHTFAVTGGGDSVVSFPGEAGTALGCAERTGDGVPPGQYGNWTPLRAGWCPGLPVPTRRFDITADVDLSGENELTYTGSYLGAEPQGGNIDLSAYLVYYR